MASDPVRVVGCDDPGPSDPVRIVNFEDLGISGVSQILVGDVEGGNYVQIYDEGILAFGGARMWDDFIRPAVGSQLESPAGRVDRNIAELTVEFAANAVYPADYIAHTYQIPHKWALGTSLRPHLHWYQIAAAIPNWLLSYRLYDNGELVPAVWTLAAIGAQLFTYPGAGTFMQIGEFPDIDAAALTGVSSWFEIRLYRDTTNASGLFAGADPAGGVASIKEFDPHALIDSFGSRQEYTK